MSRLQKVFRFCLSLAAILLAAACLPSLRAEEQLKTEQKEFFESQIRPIFVEHCYECHSVDADEVEGGLLLDSKWGWSQGGDSGPAIVPGDLEESLVIQAVRYDEEVVSAMPPKSKLSAKQIGLLEQWVTMGAPDPRPKAERTNGSLVEDFDLAKRVAEHWSWRPIQTPELPTVKDSSWPVTDWDRFILARLEQAGLRPAEEADKRVWLRRVFFDLIGLPPTREETQRFLQDDSPDAREKIVESLLHSPQFGEKWARHWMDLVRYADTYGHEFDYPIQYAHEYRDYLIRAFNADVPYDQLIREHIAGDLLDQPRRNPDARFNESIIATGFWYLHEATHAPTDVLGNEADIIDNQIDVFGKTFLGLTVACARCHDHKFDAISTADYYALSAYIQSSCRQHYPLDPGGRIAEATGKIKQLRGQAIASLRNADFEEAAIRPGPYFQAAVALLKQTNRGAAISDSAITEAAGAHQLRGEQLQRWVNLLSGVDAKAEIVDASGMLAALIWEPERALSAIRRFEDEQKKLADFRGRASLLEDFESDELPVGWSTSGTAFEVTGNHLFVDCAGAPPSKPGTIDSARLGQKQSGILRSPTFEITTRNIHVLMKATANVTINVIIDNYQMAPNNGLLFNGTFIRGGGSDTKGKWQWKTLGGDLRKYVGHQAYLEFIDQGDAAIAIDEIRFSDQGAPQPSIDPLLAKLSEGAESLDQLWESSLNDLRSGTHNPLVEWMVDSELIPIEELSGEAADALSRAREIASRIPQPRYVLAMAEGTREPAQVYVRGSHTNRGEEVPPRNLEALGGKTGSRLDLANAIASAENPLTSRVIVNRVWHHLFGRGIVPTVDDLGPQGQAPTHPDLLDWLAADFAKHGWSLKRLMRQIVLSRTYRQKSVSHPDLDREKMAVVDPTNALLHRARVRRLPAESIRDAMLAVSGRLDKRQFGRGVATHRTPFMTGRGARGSGPLDGDGRRSIYLSIYRNFLNPFMLTFDMPSPFGPKGLRSTSNVPAQALTLMNDPFVIGQAKIWANKALAEPELTPQQRIAAMVEQAHGRPPSEEQLDAFEQFLESQGTVYGKRDQRAWADLAHVLLNMKAFYYLR